MYRGRLSTRVQKKRSGSTAHHVSAEVFLGGVVLSQTLCVRTMLLLSPPFDFCRRRERIPSRQRKVFDNLGRGFCLGGGQFLNVSLPPPGTNGQEWLLIIYCWMFNHPINLTCDTGPPQLHLARASLPAISDHISPAVDGTGEYVEAGCGGGRG